MRRKLPPFFLLVLVLVLFTGACASTAKSSTAKSSTAKATKASPSTIDAVKVTGSFGTAPKVAFSTPLKVSKTSTRVVSKGSGDATASGKQALLHLLLENGTTGKPVGSTYDQGTPTSITLDSSSLPPPLVTALQGRTQGSRVAVAAPVKDIYGPSGNSSLQLKATDSLVMVFDILAVQPTAVLAGPKGTTKALPAGLPALRTKGAKITALDFSKADKPAPKKLRVVRMVTGTGPRTTAKSLVTMDYIGQVYGSKKPFNNTYLAGAPATFPVGVGGLIKAWDHALVGVPVGSRVMLVAPPSMAYGAQGSKQGGIPANATLVFVVDVLGASS